MVGLVAISASGKAQQLLVAPVGGHGAAGRINGRNALAHVVQRDLQDAAFVRQLFWALKYAVTSE
ncbi:MAG: hypothetical protein U1E71_05530 [Ramlibacter sp.]